MADNNTIEQYRIGVFPLIVAVGVIGVLVYNRMEAYVQHFNDVLGARADTTTSVSSDLAEIQQKLDSLLTLTGGLAPEADSPG